MALLLILSTPALAGPADFDPPQPVTIKGYDGQAMEPHISRGGRVLFFNNWNDPSVNTDIFYATRSDTLTFRFKGPVGGLNTETSLEGTPTVDKPGAFYFVSPRAYGKDSTTIFTANYRPDGTVSEVRQVQGNLSPGRPLWFNMDVEVSADGMTLYATDNRKGPTGGPPASSEFFIARKTAPGAFERDPAGPAIMKNVNEPGALQYAAGISEDELTLYFTRLYPEKNDIGLYVSTRSDKKAAFAKPQRIESITGFVEAPTVAPRGCGIYFHRKDEDGVHRIWYAHKTGCGEKAP